MSIQDKSQLFGIIEKFKNSNHPEITHFRKGNHPGKEWYLKTVCPMPNLQQIDRMGYGELWEQLQDEYPDVIKLVPEAYDWDGIELPYMISIWIYNDTDVIFNYNDSIDQLEVIFADRDVGQQMQLEKIKNIISIEKDKFINSIIDDNTRDKYNMELDNISEIVNHLKSNFTNTSQTKNKKQFKIVTGGKFNNDESS